MSTMLRIGLAIARPSTYSLKLSTPALNSTFKARTFVTFRPNVLQAIYKRQASSGFSSNFFKSSRSFMTDSSPVVARPTQSEAWKRYAITFVSSTFGHSWNAGIDLRIRAPSQEQSLSSTAFSTARLETRCLPPNGRICMTASSTLGAALFSPPSPLGPCSALVWHSVSCLRIHGWFSVLVWLDQLVL